MPMRFQKEVGALLDNNQNILCLVEGSATHVDIPQELAWTLHKNNPGGVYAFAHTHPNGMTELSSLDESLLKAWCLAFYPYPFRIITLTYTDNWIETSYLGLLEPKEIWKTRDKPKENRKFEIIQEYSVSHYFLSSPDLAHLRPLMERSYE